MAVDWWQAKSRGTGRTRLESNKMHHHTATHQQRTVNECVQCPSGLFTFLRWWEATVVCIVSLVVHDKAVVDKIETVGASFIRAGNHLTH